jgi:hypothetical protein
MGICGLAAFLTVFCSSICGTTSKQKSGLKVNTNFLNTATRLLPAMEQFRTITESSD